MNRVDRPNIHSFHDYRDYLRRFFQFRQSSDPKFSLRGLAREAKLAAGYLPMVMNGSRALSYRALEKLSPAMGLTSQETRFLELLCRATDSKSVTERGQALLKMQRRSNYREANRKETESYRYLSHWYYVAIRELAGIPGFQPEPEWIQSRLHYRVGLPQIVEALDFLFSAGFLSKLEDGTVVQAEKDVNCGGGVYSVALSNFHREMLELAKFAIDEVKQETREIRGHTLQLSPGGVKQAKEILKNAYREIAGLEPKEKSATSVYHLEAALFPLAGPDSRSRK